MFFIPMQNSYETPCLGHDVFPSALSKVSYTAAERSIGYDDFEQEDAEG